MDPDDIRSDPDDQAARGLSPDEQRAERDEESQAMEDTKFHHAVELEREEREGIAERLDEPPAARDEG